VPASSSAGGTWVLLAFCGFLAGQVLSAVVVAVVAAMTGHSRDLNALMHLPVLPLWLEVASFLGLWPGFLGAVLLASYRFGSGRVGRDMGFAIRWPDILFGGIVGLAAQLVLLPVLYLPLQPFVHNLDQRLGGPAKQLTGGSGADKVVTALLTIVVVPVIEELFFRGLLLRGLLRLFSGAGRALGPVLAIVANGLLFGVAHAEGLQFIGLAAVGALLAVLAYRTGRLGPSFFAHAAFNLVAVVASSSGGALH
jgi:hypothetical protein